MSDVQTTSGVNIRSLLYRNRAISAISVFVPNTEVTIALPVGVKKFIIKTRGNSDLKIATMSGQVTQVNGNYVTWWAGSYYEESNIDVVSAAQTLYVSVTAADSIELITWF